MSWSTFILELRNYMELTQDEFAHTALVKSHQVSRWERGLHEPNKTHQRTLRNLAREHNFPIPKGLDKVPIKW